MTAHGTCTLPQTTSQRDNRKHYLYIHKEDRTRGEDLRVRSARTPEGERELKTESALACFILALVVVTATGGLKKASASLLYTLL